MFDENTLKVFYRIFQGNEAFYVHLQAPFKEEEGKLKAAWCGFAVYGTKSFPGVPKGFEKGDFVPVTKERYREHLNGGNGIAIAPLCNTKDKKNVCYFAAIDIDVYNTNFTYLVGRLYQHGFKFAAFLSKSGGLHLYFFFMVAESGEKVIEALNKIVEVFGLNRLYVNDKKKSKVEVFPKQAAFIPGDKNVNCLFLPFYNSAGKCRNKMITADGKFVGIEKAIPVMESMFTSVKEINNTLSNLPYSDAPFCIQMILLTGALAENDGRNNFLFSASMYLKKKYKENFKDTLEEMNNCLEVPLEDYEINSIYNSATYEKENRDKYLCKKSPCADYCDKKLCKLREFGLGRDKNNLFTGADCWGPITKYNSGGGKEPYYSWEVRVEEGGEYKIVQIDSEKDLLNQTVMQQNCLRDLNWIPFRVRDNDWVTNVRKCLVGIEERTIEIAEAVDTTERAALRRAFMKFLTHKQIQNDIPCMIKIGLVYHADGAYKFTTDGLMDFLRLGRHQLGRINLQRELEHFGCTEDKIVYTNAKGTKVNIPCWKKLEDDDLLSMGSYYEDIYEGYADIIQKNVSDKKDKETEKTDGYDTKF